VRRQAIGRVLANELWIVKSHLPEFQGNRWFYRLVAKGQDQDDPRKRVFLMQKVDPKSRMPMGWCLCFKETGTDETGDWFVVGRFSHDLPSRDTWPPHWFKNKREEAA